MNTPDQPSPVVSVCVAVYNHADFLPACLDSILGQTFQQFEIVAVDDGSTDGSLDILKEYQLRFPDQVKISWHPEHGNRGVSATSNLAIRSSRGKYIAFVGDDDVWLPDKLERQVTLLEMSPQLAMAYSPVIMIDRAGQRISGSYGIDITGDLNPVGKMLLFCHTPAMTVIMRRACLDDTGLFNETLAYSDWDLMIRTFARWGVGHISEPLALYRIHQSNMSHGNRPDIELERILGVMKTVDAQRENTGGALLLPQNQALLALQLAFLHFCGRDYKTAAGYVRTAVLRHPTLGSQLDRVKEWLISLQYSFYTPVLPHFGLWLASQEPFCKPTLSEESLLHWLLELQETRQFFIQRGMEDSGFRDDANSIFSDIPASLTIPPQWKKGVLGELYPALLFSAFKKGDRRKARNYWWRTISKYPGWLRNRGVWSIGLQVLLPSDGQAEMTVD